MASNDALKLVQEAASAIVDDRRRLNEMFEHLRRAVSTYDPALTLSDDAKLVSIGQPPPPEVRVEITKGGREEQMRLRVRAFLTTHGPTKKVDVIEEMDAAPAEVALAIEQLLGEDSIIHKLSNGDTVVEVAEEKETPPSRVGTPDDLVRQRKTRDEQVLDALLSGPATYMELREKTGFYDSKLAEALSSLGRKVSKTGKLYYHLPGVEVPVEDDRLIQVSDAILGYGRPVHYDALKKLFPSWNVRPVLEELLKQGTIRKEPTGLYIHKDAATLVPPRREPSRGSGTRQDVSPGRTRPPTTPPSQPSPVSTESRTDSQVGHGLARSPQPRSEMKSQKREAEERLDSIVLWAQDQGEEFDPLTARRDLGVRVVGSENYKRDGVFSNDSMASTDFKLLAERGVFESTGVQKQPKWKINAAKGLGRNHKMGRGTNFYRFPKADAQPATKEQVGEQEQEQDPTQSVSLSLEQVRDAAVELKDFTTAELIMKLGIRNTNRARHQVREHMAVLVLRKMFTFDAMEDGGAAFRWSYIEPPKETEGERIIRQQIQHRQIEREENRTARAVGVAGTGKKKMKTPHEATQQILDLIKKQWGDVVTKTGGNHFMVKVPSGPHKGEQIYLASTPGSRMIAKTKGRLRAAGLQIA